MLNSLSHASPSSFFFLIEPMSILLFSYFMTLNAQWMTTGRPVSLFNPEPIVCFYIIIIVICNLFLLL